MAKLWNTSYSYWCWWFWVYTFAAKEILGLTKLQKNHIRAWHRRVVHRPNKACKPILESGEIKRRRPKGLMVVSAWSWWNHLMSTLGFKDFRGFQDWMSKQEKHAKQQNMSSKHEKLRLQTVHGLIIPFFSFMASLAICSFLNPSKNPTKIWEPSATNIAWRAKVHLCGPDGRFGRLALDLPEWNRVANSDSHQIQYINSKSYKSFESGVTFL